MSNAVIAAKTGSAYIEFPFVSTNDVKLPARTVVFERNLLGGLLYTDVGYDESNREIFLNFSTNTIKKDALQIAAQDNSNSYVFSDGTNVWDILIMSFDYKLQSKDRFLVTMTLRVLVKNV